MQPRLDYAKVDPEANRAMAALETYVRRCGLETSLLELVRVRASLINGCAFCIDMHTKGEDRFPDFDHSLPRRPVL